MISLSFIKRLLAQAFVTLLLVVSGCGVLPSGPDKRGNVEPEAIGVQIETISSIGDFIDADTCPPVINILLPDSLFPGHEFPYDITFTIASELSRFLYNRLKISHEL